ncbi:hypothetical protein FJT64_012887 [Amphibalanus amphitrite]|uniref:Uncharacterized protein n=1 Tax=Amphibalanus amphitrite TaxID=1232801 RepID=A0A6A4VBS8_AMPAM|nr:hypothetical protein FJT64_012887 [Amphibalanus amphitrite]
MERETLKKAMMECFKDGEFQSILKEIVAEAMAVKDAEIADLRDQLKKATTHINELEQYSRRLCVNVSGVPETPNESTDQIIMDLGKMAGVTVTPADLDRTHRIGKGTGGKSEDHHRQVHELLKAPGVLQLTTRAAETSPRARVGGLNGSCWEDLRLGQSHTG